MRVMPEDTMLRLEFELGKRKSHRQDRHHWSDEHHLLYLAPDQAVLELAAGKPPTSSDNARSARLWSRGAPTATIQRARLFSKIRAKPPSLRSWELHVADGQHLSMRSRGSS